MNHWRIVAFALTLLWSPLACALNPSRQVSQYGHDAWRMQDGFIGPANAVAQTRDGYLWIATNMGLIRFDGVRFVPWIAPPGQALPDSRINNLFIARDTSLWIGTQNGIARLKDDVLTSFDVRGQIDSMAEGDDGTIWIARAHLAAGDRDSPICSYHREQFHCYKGTGMPFQWATAIARAEDGYWWIGSSSGICRWKPGHLAMCDLPETLASAGGSLGVSDVMPTANGLLVGIARTGPGLGLEEFVDGAWKAFSATGVDSLELDVNVLLRDRDGGIWVGTSSHGLYRLYQGRAERFSSADGLSSDTVSSLYEDAEGTIWAATSKGLDSFRELHITSFSKREGLSADLVDSVVADDDGNLWIGNEGALDVLRGNTIKAITTKDGLPGRRVTSLLKDRAGRLWVGTDDRLSIFEHGQFSAVTMPGGAQLGTVWRLTEDSQQNLWAIVVGGPQKLLHIRDRSVQEVIDPVAAIEPNSLAADPAGGIWLGHGNGKLAHSRHERFEEMPRPDASNAVFTSLFADSRNSVWATSISGLVRWKDGMHKILGPANGLPCAYVFAAIADTRNSLWLNTGCGIITITEAELDRWWNDPSVRVKYRLFDALDGALPYNADFQPKAERSLDGRIWFATGGVLQMVDPARIEKLRPPPPVRIENVTADRKDFQPVADLRLPALSRDIRIDYTALSFIAPQKIVFRYRLEGHDDAWEDAGSRRQAFYTNLHPGNYRFRVTAANSDGIWAESDATLAFVIPPVFYQTNWFLVLCLLAASGLACLGYFARVHQVSARIEDRLEARASERERIARDLHDTLLQSTQALILDFQAEADSIAKDDPLRRRMEAVLDRADKSLADARDVVVELRAPMETTADLPHALATAVEELGQRDAPPIRIFVEGEQRPLRADVRDEAYRIGREALLNAIRHAQATLIEIQLAYDTARFILRVRDNGRGIDPNILRAGQRPGHWGITGMRERAGRFGGQLDVWSRPASGTEVELSVPAAVAYSTQAVRHRAPWLRRLMIGDIGES